MKNGRSDNVDTTDLQTLGLCFLGSWRFASFGLFLTRRSQATAPVIRSLSETLELLKRATTEKIEFDTGKMPPLSFDHGFPLVYKQFVVYVQDPRYRGRVAENGAIAGGLVLALFGGLALALFLTRRTNQYGDARFGTLSEASDARLLAKQGMIVGTLAGRTLISNDPGHVLIVGPTRSGKGVSFVIPNGLTWGGSMVVLDIKGENALLFGQARAARGDKVFVFAPGSLYIRTATIRSISFGRGQNGDGLREYRWVPCGWVWCRKRVDDGSSEGRWGLAWLCDDKRPF